MNMLISTKNRVFISLVGPSEKNTTCLQLAQNWNLSTKVCQKLVLYQHSQPLYVVMQKEYESVEIVQGVKFEFIDSLKNNGTKYLITFDNSCEEFAIKKRLLMLLLLEDIMG